MNEFEWRRQMQNLRQPMMPQRDLWPAIDQALNVHDANPAAPLPASSARFPRRRRWLGAAGVAAAVLLSIGTGWHLALESRTEPATGNMMASPMASRWKPADPRLAGAAIELDAARMELKQAMLQAPDSPALQRLLARTEHQQAQLHQLTGQAG